MDTANRWLLELPIFENGFSFNDQVAQLLLTLILIAAGLALTFAGLRAMKTALLIAVAALSGWAGVVLVNRLTNPNELLEMIFFITIAFFGTCGFYFLSVLWKGLLDMLGFHVSLERWLWPLAAAAGGAVLGGVVWLRLYRWAELAAGLAVFFGAVGILVQRRSRHRRRAVHTYEEIYHMKRKGGIADAGGKPEGTEIPS